MYEKEKESESITTAVIPLFPSLYSIEYQLLVAKVGGGEESFLSGVVVA